MKSFTNVNEPHTIEALFVNHYPAPLSIPRTGAVTGYGYDTRDDGNLQKGEPWPEPRFVDNGDGTLTDRLTGLMWLKYSRALGIFDWSGALNLMNTLNTDPESLSLPGYTNDFDDWRLPNVNELRSLFTNADKADIQDWLESFGFDNVGISWTSTTVADASYPQNAWAVSTAPMGANLDIYSKSSTLGIIASRGTSTGPSYIPKTGQNISVAAKDDGQLQRGTPSPQPRFTDNGDTVTDDLSGLARLFMVHDVDKDSIPPEASNIIVSGGSNGDGAIDFTVSGDDLALYDLRKIHEENN